ncbi:MAG: hypothetical protein HPY66_1524 [Firmicutes bacterium]|nr:hypothetical protein [Bacillota bacterium]
MDKRIEKLKVEIENCRRKLQEELDKQDFQASYDIILNTSRELDRLIVEYEQLTKIDRYRSI